MPGRTKRPGLVVCVSPHIIMRHSCTETPLDLIGIDSEGTQFLSQGLNPPGLSLPGFCLYLSPPIRCLGLGKSELVIAIIEAQEWPIRDEPAIEMRTPESTQRISRHLNQLSPCLVELPTDQPRIPVFPKRRILGIKEIV